MAKKNGPTDPVLAELVAIKRLLVFALLREGAKQEDIGKALGVNKSNVSRMFPDGIGKAVRGTAKD